MEFERTKSGEWKAHFSYGPINFSALEKTKQEAGTAIMEQVQEFIDGMQEKINENIM